MSLCLLSFLKKTILILCQAILPFLSVWSQSLAPYFVNLVFISMTDLNPYGQVSIIVH
jgi:hypothetical protein